ncbi:hypothetical protein Ami103574_15420 [Aminipila butyrica]|uniref:Uncharacterized protein n=1 Tax=Aminipila butyrica TaxID=433296 RepID=A0A858BZD0_9FIRM|nr:hypothetical protein [Aminipila butyrica]QIB70599.1 hypothetical protein Ami103574_15420 [Aminipila butyrica]
MEYVIGAIVGILYGGLAGLLKYIFLWKKLLTQQAENLKIEAVTTRLFISYFVNALVLLIVFLIRDKISLDFTALIIGTAFALVVSGKFFSVQKVMERNGKSDL